MTKNYFTQGGALYCTICEFQKKHLNAIKSVFINAVKLALEIGLIQNSDIFAIDGSKIEANSSHFQTKSKQMFVALSHIFRR